MDITSEDFVNKNLYEFCHAEDLQKLHKAHVDCKWLFHNSIIYVILFIFVCGKQLLIYGYED